MPDTTSYTLNLNNSPADQDLLDALNLIEVEDDAALASAFRLRIPIGLDDEGDWTWVAEDALKPLTPVSIGVRFGSEVNELLISGYITSHQIHFDKEVGASFLEVIGMDASTLMNLEEKVVAWNDMSDSDIVSQILSSYSFTPEVDDTQPSYAEDEVTIIQRGTDLAFVRRLAKRNGFEFYLETDANSGETAGHFHKPRLSDQPQKDLALAFGDDSNVYAMDAHYDGLRPSIVDAAGISIGDKSDQSASITSSDLDTLGADAALELLDQQPKSLLARTSAFDNAELQTRAQAAVDAASWAVSLSGELDITAYEGVLRSRRTVLVKGIGTRYSGTYYVTRVVHTLTPGGYKQKFQLTRNALGLSGSESFGSSADVSVSSAAS
ncbi:MAG TPA: contractile injection system protein, VgrG/Pvc8 family [Anaerolineales bacterium]|nr:contractile injection system protein, VgrG/Pvc8 family [Anaerolineales bacterium]